MEAGSLDTATPVTTITTIFFARHSAIVSWEKLYEIDLDNCGWGAGGTLWRTLPSISSPLATVRISRQDHEYLRSFAEYEAFVDEFRCRCIPTT